MSNLDHISDFALVGYVSLSALPPEALHCTYTCSAAARLALYVGNLKFIDEQISWPHW